ncbi:sulfotransferase family protein [Actinomadura kijaniata]|nr:sulfotransferase [Actinomadura namibiensis]
MDVIGAGYGRTGTLSLKAALERLGFGPCHHMSEMLRPGQLDAWRAKTRGEPVAWETLFSGYRSCVDWPSAAYWRETAEHYPDAKVVLSVRDPKGWVASMRATILDRHSRQDSAPVRLMLGASRTLGTGVAKFVEMTSRMPEIRDFPGLSDEELVAAFERHTREVVAAIPPERLLVFEVRQGWEPLCAFLGVPVPDEPFPRVNDTAAFNANARRMMLRLMVQR